VSMLLRAVQVALCISCLLAKKQPVYVSTAPELKELKTEKACAGAKWKGPHSKTPTDLYWVIASDIQPFDITKCECDLKPPDCETRPGPYGCRKRDCAKEQMKFQLKQKAEEEERRKELAAIKEKEEDEKKLAQLKAVQEEQKKKKEASSGEEDEGEDGDENDDEDKKKKTTKKKVTEGDGDGDGNDASDEGDGGPLPPPDHTKEEKDRAACADVMKAQWTPRICEKEVGCAVLLVGGGDPVKESEVCVTDRDKVARENGCKDKGKVHCEQNAERCAWVTGSRSVDGECLAKATQSEEENKDLWDAEEPANRAEPAKKDMEEEEEEREKNEREAREKREAQKKELADAETARQKEREKNEREAREKEEKERIRAEAEAEAIERENDVKKKLQDLEENKIREAAAAAAEAEAKLAEQRAAETARKVKEAAEEENKKKREQTRKNLEDAEAAARKKEKKRLREESAEQKRLREKAETARKDKEAADAAEAARQMAKAKKLAGEPLTISIDKSSPGGNADGQDITQNVHVQVITDKASSVYRGDKGTTMQVRLWAMPEDIAKICDEDDGYIDRGSDLMRKYERILAEKKKELECLQNSLVEVKQIENDYLDKRKETVRYDKLVRLSEELDNTLNEAAANMLKKIDKDIDRTQEMSDEIEQLNKEEGGQ